MGATTIWERWDSLLPDGTVNPSGMTSFNHYAFGAVADWMHRVVAGLAPAAPGYGAANRPPAAARGLTAASARAAHAVRATPSSSWRLEDGQLRLTVDVPVGATAMWCCPPASIAGRRPRHPCVPEPFEVEAQRPDRHGRHAARRTSSTTADAMAVLTGVITKHIPEAAEHMSGALRGQEQLTPRQISGMLPRPDGVLDRSRARIRRVSAGEEIPRDVITAPVPTEAEDDDLEAKAALLTGRDFWSTHEGEGIRVDRPGRRTPRRSAPGR